MSVNVEDFKQELEFVYKDERYSVRDNGALLRHCREGNRPRPTDNKWTFGKPSEKTGYMEIATVRVHRIVAMAFHGEPPTKEHVVDHIDTNKRNNRLENLRWVTRLENVLLNPITAKRIELVCGSVEAFLENPSKFRNKFPEPNYQWMCTVSKEESQASLERLINWAKSDNRPSGGSLGEWLFNRTTSLNLPIITTPEEPEVMLSLTLGAAQCDWSTPSEFPNIPQNVGDNPLVLYADNLKKKVVFSQNQYGSSLVLNNGFSDDHQSIYVMTESSEGDAAIKRYALAKVTYVDNLFVHTSIQSFFSKEGAEKQFTIALGLEWTGGDSIDDYCSNDKRKQNT